MQETLVRFLGQEDPLEKGEATHSSILGLPLRLSCNVEDLGSVPGLGRFPGKEKGYPLQYSGLENPMDYTVHGVTKSQTGLSHFHFDFGRRQVLFIFQQCSKFISHIQKGTWNLSLHFKK